MTIQYLTKPEWKIDTPGFENIIYGESSADQLDRSEIESHCREYGPGFRLPSADEAIAFRSAVSMRKRKDWTGMPRSLDVRFDYRIGKEYASVADIQLTGTVFAYLNIDGKPHFAFADPRTPRIAADLSSSEEHDGLVTRFNDPHNKRSNGKLLTLPISDSGVRTLIWRAELTNRIVPVPVEMYTQDCHSVSTVLEENGTSKYGRSPLVKAILPKTSEMNAAMMRERTQWITDRGGIDEGEGKIESTLDHIHSERLAIGELAHLPKNKVAIGMVTLLGDRGSHPRSNLHKIYLEFEADAAMGYRGLVRPVREDIGEPQFVNVNESWHLFCGKG